MCLAVPGQILTIRDEEPRESVPALDASFLRTGRVNFGGIVKEVSLAYVPEAAVGNYVIVHAGFAISQVDEEEAARGLEYARGLDDFRDLEVEVT